MAAAFQSVLHGRSITTIRSILRRFGSPELGLSTAGDPLGPPLLFGEWGTGTPIAGEPATSLIDAKAAALNLADLAGKYSIDGAALAHLAIVRGTAAEIVDGLTVLDQLEHAVAKGEPVDRHTAEVAAVVDAGGGRIGSVTPDPPSDPEEREALLRKIYAEDPTGRTWWSLADFEEVTGIPRSSIAKTRFWRQVIKPARKRLPKPLRPKQDRSRPVEDVADPRPIPELKD